ncbi:MAG: hypothetical protein AAF356_05955 [Planctomycetota bacterium]
MDEFVSMEQRFIQRDWGIAELDGAKFCEVLARLLYQADAGTVSRSRSFGDCLSYLERDGVAHALVPRHDALHICKSLRLVYKFRNQRGVAHISPNYTPSHMDARLVIEVVRWCMSESLRVLGQAEPEATAKMIRELLQFDVPAIGVYEDLLLVQRTDLSVQDELVVLLHYAGESGMSRRDLGRFSMGSPPSVTRALSRLAAAESRQVIQLPAGNYRLTDLGARYVREQLADKLLVE